MYCRCNEVEQSECGQGSLVGNAKIFCSALYFQFEMVKHLCFISVLIFVGDGKSTHARM